MEIFGIGAAVIGPAIALGLIGFSAYTAIGRNPSAAKDIKGSLIIALAFAEGLGIIATVLAFVVLFLK